MDGVISWTELYVFLERDCCWGMWRRWRGRGCGRGGWRRGAGFLSEKCRLPREVWVIGNLPQLLIGIVGDQGIFIAWEVGWEFVMGAVLIWGWFVGAGVNQ